MPVRALATGPRAVAGCRLSGDRREWHPGPRASTVSVARRGYGRIAGWRERRRRVRRCTRTSTEALRCERLPRLQRPRKSVGVGRDLGSTGHSQSLGQTIRMCCADGRYRGGSRSAAPAPPSGRGRRGSRTPMSGGGGSSSQVAGTASSQRRRTNLIRRTRRLLRPQRSLPIAPMLARSLFAQRPQCGL